MIKKLFIDFQEPPVSAQELNEMQDNIDNAKLEKSGGHVTGDIYMDNDSEMFFSNNVTVKTPQADTRVHGMQLAYNNGWKLNVTAQSGNDIHVFQVDLTQIS